ncbi:MAG: DMT family transporter [Firmicutes bacterium]|nr:DMT family transporter [Bacillota bacterium]
MNSKFSDRTKGLIAAVAATTIYGISFVIIKHSTDTADPFYLLTWRIAGGFLALTVLAALGVFKVRLKGRDLKPLILMGLFYPTLYQITEFLGVHRTTASESAALNALIPLVGMLASTVVLKKIPLRRQVIGVIVSIAGVIAGMIGKEISASLDVPGYLLLFAALISFGLYEVIVESASEFTTIEKIYVIMGIGTVFCLAISLIKALAAGELAVFASLPFQSGYFLFVVLYLALGCSIVACFLENYSISTLGTNRYSTLTGICTVVTIVGSVIFLHEEFTLLQVIGVVMILAGVLIANREG